jgi:hypothetical protein
VQRQEGKARPAQEGCVPCFGGRRWGRQRSTWAASSREAAGQLPRSAMGDHRAARARLAAQMPHDVAAAAVMNAVVIRQRKPWRRKEGTVIYFEDNAGVIVNPKGEMKGGCEGISALPSQRGPLPVSSRAWDSWAHRACRPCAASRRIRNHRPRRQGVRRPVAPYRLRSQLHHLKVSGAWAAWEGNGCGTSWRAGRAREPLLLPHVARPWPHGEPCTRSLLSSPSLLRADFLLAHVEFLCKGLARKQSHREREERTACGGTSSHA